MKIIKTYESYNLDELDLGEFSKRIKKSKLIPNPDGTFDYNGDITFGLMDLNSLKEIPIMFYRIHGDFNCAYNYLFSLEGSPRIVDGDFSCSENGLISLQYAPLEVGGDFDCSRNLLFSKFHLSKIKGEINFNYNTFEITEFVIETVKAFTYEQQMKELDFFKQNDLKAFEMMEEVLNSLGVNYGPETRSMVGVMKGYTNAKEMF